MLDSDDIKKLLQAMTAVFYTKEEMDAKFNAMDEKFSVLQASIDGIAKSNADHQQEIITLNYRMKNTEEWIDQASPKLGVTFKY